MAFRNTPYETIAASQTDQVMGPVGAAGDIIDSILVVPATTSPGAISIKDSSTGAAITVFTGGATSVSNLVPFPIPLGNLLGGMKSIGTGATKGWLVTTGANVSAIAFGQFT